MSEARTKDWFEEAIGVIATFENHLVEAASDTIGLVYRPEVVLSKAVSRRNGTRPIFHFLFSVAVACILLWVGIAVILQIDGPSLDKNLDALRKVVKFLGEGSNGLWALAPLVLGAMLTGRVAALGVRDPSLKLLRQQCAIYATGQFLTAFSLGNLLYDVLAPGKSGLVLTALQRLPALPFTFLIGMALRPGFGGPGLKRLQPYGIGLVGVCCWYVFWLWMAVPLLVNTGSR